MGTPINKSNFKGTERQIAKLFGTVRTPLSGGSSRHTRSDTLSDTLYIECKKRKHMAIHVLYADTKKKALAEGKIPVVVTKETGLRITLITTEPQYMEAVTGEITDETRD